MRKTLCIAAWLISATQLAFAQEPTSGQVSAAPAVTSALKLNDATPVLLRTTRDISSGMAKVGDQVQFKVVDDVKTGDLIVICRGAEAQGQLIAVQTRGRKGRSGSLDIGIEWVQLLTGEHAALRAVKHSEGRPSSMVNDMETVDIGKYGEGLPLLPLLLLEKGHDARLPAGSKIGSYVNGTVTLDRAALERAQPVVVRRAGPATVTIFRPKFPVARAYAPTVYCGNVALTRLHQERYFRIQLPAGKYSFRSNDEQDLDLQLEEGQDIYIQMQIVIHGLSAKGHIEQIPSGEGEDEVAGLREADAKEVTRVSAENLAELQAVPRKK